VTRDQERLLHKQAKEAHRAASLLHHQAEGNESKDKEALDATIKACELTAQTGNDTEVERYIQDCADKAFNHATTKSICYHLKAACCHTYAANNHRQLER
jgi:hypothetical protein